MEDEFKRLSDEELEELIERIEFAKSFSNLYPTACKHCSNNPANGGSGVCNCTLGTPTIY